MDQRAIHALPAAEVAGLLAADPVAGLTGDEARDRLALHGPNRPRQPRRPPYIQLALAQFADPLVLLLVGAAAVSIAIGDVGEGLAIAAILVLNGVLGFWQEAGAERAILALSQSFATEAIVVRDGSPSAVPAEDVVPGDLLLVAAGERVAADARVVRADGLELDESALTGESLPVTKRADATDVAAPLAERSSMVYAGSAVTRGHGRALVSATGSETEIGHIEVLATAATAPQTPLARRLGRLARQMVALGVLITAGLAGAELARGAPAHEAFLVGVAVAVAAVPEGLAATVTAALALGARAMAQRGAIVRRLEAIETLGETSVICTDKTGTLTQNAIRVAALRPAAGTSERELLRAALRASNADDELAADPIERALVLAAAERGLTPCDQLRESRVRELAFDSDRMRMTVVYASPEGLQAFMKGAPEVVAARSAPEEALASAAEAWAGEGLRVLAVSTRRVESLDENIEEGHELLGLVALHDPLRATAAASVAAAQASGIEVRMITGDHPATAATIARSLGLPDTAVVARATPADKIALVEELQRRGEIVAVTGDGINDAPALRRADVGVAMGESGTEAAREAAAIVLTDDDFSTIVAAVEEGRRIGDNIRKFVAFLLSANLGEVLVFAVAIVAGLGVPLAVIQVLLVNLITDGLPALALARDPTAVETMHSPPRRTEQLFDRRSWSRLAAIGLLVGAATLGSFVAGRGFGEGAAQTMAFVTLALSELALVFAMRSPTAHPWHLPPNPWLTSSVLASVVLVAAIVYAPGLHDVFATTALDSTELGAATALALVPLGLVELAKAVNGFMESRSPKPSPTLTRAH